MALGLMYFFAHFLYKGVCLNTRWLLNTLIAITCAALSATTQAESWPPLNPPQPLPLQWVLDKALIRNPTIQSETRSYNAALEMVKFSDLLDEAALNAGAVNRLDTPAPYRALAEADAELARIAVAEHHLNLAYNVRIAYFRYYAAYETALLAEQRLKFFSSFGQVLNNKTHLGPQLTDSVLETALAQADLVLAKQQQQQEASQLNVLLDRDLRNTLSTPNPGEPSPLPGNRDELINQALKQGIAMRRINAEIKRSAATMTLVKQEPIERILNLGRLNVGRSLATDPALKQYALGAVTHELGRHEETLRAIEPETVAFVLAQHDAARVRFDILKLYASTILPRLQKLEQNTMTAYGTGLATLAQVAEAMKARVAARQANLAMRIEYETAIAELLRANGQLPRHMSKFAAQAPIPTPASGVYP